MSRNRFDYTQPPIIETDNPYEKPEFKEESAETTEPVESVYYGDDYLSDYKTGAIGSEGVVEEESVYYGDDYLSDYKTGAIGSEGVVEEESPLSEPQPEIPVFDTEQPYTPYDPDLYKKEAQEDVGEVIDPLIEGAEKEKETIDIGAKMQIAGIEKAIPYVTRQFEAYQAKHGLGTGMQMRQSNELIMDIAETIGDVYDSATLAKLGIDSKISEYQSARASGELERATELYNQAQSQAMFASEVLGQPYVQPEIGYIYDQMTAHQSIIKSIDSTAAEKATAQTALDGFTQALKDIGYSGDIGEGLQTYQSYQREVEQYMLEMNDWIASESYDTEMYSMTHTWNALRDLQSKKITFEEIADSYPYADYDFLLEVQAKITTGDIDWSNMTEEEMQEWVEENIG